MIDTDPIITALAERCGVRRDGKYWTADAPLDAERFETAAGLVGRNGAPGLLYDLYFGKLIPPETLRRVLVGVWSDAEYPESLVKPAQWVYWFREAAYPPPAEPLTVYRGATPHHARRMSWTTNPSRAQWFADRYGRFADSDERFRPAFVYVATVEPAGVLADVDAMEGEGGRREEEIVIDPAYLPKPLRRLDQGEDR